MTVEAAADPTIVSITGPQTIREVAQTHAVLLDALRGDRAVALDCREVTEVDLSFVQLILSARRSADAAGRALGLLHPPAGALAEALVRGGLLQREPVDADADPGRWAARGKERA